MLKMMSHDLLTLFSFCLLVDSSKCVEVACSNDTNVNAVCECTERTRTVNCTNRGLNEWPVGIPVNKKFLYLSDNNLNKIDTNALLELQELISINLANNSLTSLPEFPKTIYSINIDHNRISILKNTTFQGSNLVNHLLCTVYLLINVIVQ
ncbi:trophoblast glycoprotein-like isoform X2 [Antedon mediterranea]|uniref:trophoblast glycoprotein-like isoform X2 n=1 Tax=Antedon mediterranea TaxID=105859 RepID=UPI003AF81F6A